MALCLGAIAIMATAQTDTAIKVGLLSMIPWGISAVVMVLWGAHSDKTGERRWHVAGSLLLTVTGLIGLTLVGHAPIPSLIVLTL
ncbi:MAG: hypothetical protein EBR47_07380, partial [Betaproteobacteria bacterium]|nr:hypothetical protein [Betaproteobacteria bacterium]